MTLDMELLTVASGPLASPGAVSGERHWRRRRWSMKLGLALHCMHCAACIMSPISRMPGNSTWTWQRRLLLRCVGRIGCLESPGTLCRVVLLLTSDVSGDPRCGRTYCSLGDGRWLPGTVRGHLLKCGGGNQRGHQLRLQQLLGCVAGLLRRKRGASCQVQQH